MKICLLANDYVQQFPLKGYGGVEICVESLARALHEYGHDFFVIVPKRTDIKEYPFEICETKTQPTSISQDSSYNFALSARRIILDRRPDVIWSQSHWSADALYELGIPIICTFHDSCEKKCGWIKRYPNVRYRFLSQFSYDNWVTEDWEKQISFVAYSGLVTDDYQLNENPEDYLLWVGGLRWGTKAKGLDYVIRLSRVMTNQEFRVYGSGGTDAVRLMLEHHSELYPNFKYLGELERGEDHIRAFANAKALLMPTRIPDTFPRVVIEALSKGTPVIGSDCGSLPETIGSAGFLIDPDDPKELGEFSFKRHSVYDWSMRYHIANEINSLMSVSESLS